MFSSLVLSFREGLEAALVVAIILTFLVQTGRKDLIKHVILGASIGAVVSIVGGFASFKEAQELGESAEELFEGAMMLLASGLITYFIVWMSSQSKGIGSTIKEKVNNNTSIVGLLLLSFLSVFREGLELAVFTLTKVSEKASNVALGSIIGIILAVIVTFIIFKSSVKLNLKVVFKALGLILIFIGAEMFAEGILEFIPFNSEAVELALKLVFIVPSLYFFIKDDIVKRIKKA